MKAADPCLVRVALDVLIVHKERVFRQDNVWFMVYKGALPDAMLSDHFLNNIPCIDQPGVTMIDTRERPNDFPLLLQQMDDYRDLSSYRVNVARALPPDVQCAQPPACVSVNATIPAHDPIATPSGSNAASASFAAEPGAPSDASSAPLKTEHERIQALLAEMRAQRTALSERLGKPISTEAFQACMSILDRFPENFRPPGDDPCKLGLYRIVLRDKSVFHVALPRRVNPVMLAEIRRQVAELVAQGAVERCLTRPSSIYAIVMARRPNAPGKYRLCVDISEGNKNTVPEAYAIPEISQALDRLSGQSLYCTFDFSSWFHQFEIAEEDRDKVAFIVPGDNLTPPQIYRYKRVAFGLMNATYFCQRKLQEALETWPGCAGIFPFVDDIVIGAETLDEMLVKLEAFMQFCKHYNIRLKKEKTELATTAVKHVGFIISKEGQSLDPARIDSLLNIGAPKNVDGIKALLGSFGFIRAWIADCAGIAAPLTDLMSGTAKRLKFEWGPAQEAALDALKLAAELSPAKMAPDYTLPFHLYVDASDVGVAAVLIQWRENSDGQLLPFAIGHFSRRFAIRERKWEISIRELYAIKYGLFKCKEYLQGCPNITVWSDHLNIVNGLWQHSAPKIQRWRLFLESMRPFQLRHVSGTDRMQLAADSLSRLHVSNLKLPCTAEELDPATIRMMERGEGEDDVQMFGEPYTKDAWSQLCLDDIRAHNCAVSSFHPIPIADAPLHHAYGIGYRLFAKDFCDAALPASEVCSHRAPLQLQANKRRMGLGYQGVFRDSGKRQRGGPSVVSPTTPSVVLPCVSNASLSSTSSHFDVDWVGDWTEDEENRTCPSPSLGHCSGFSNVASSSQTSAQDYQDLARHQSGVFSLRETLERAHDDTHPGFLCTWRRVVKALGPRPGISGAAIKEETRRFCDACVTCQKIKPARHKLNINSGCIRGKPFSSYAFDVVTLSTPDADGYRYILVCVDSFSRAVELFALKHANAAEVFQALYDVLCRWGTPHELRCDNAKAFTCAMVKTLLSRSKVKQRLTAPYSHQSNGQVENANRRVMDILRALVVDDRLGVNTSLKWSLLLPQVRRVIMTRTVLQHGCTPNDLAYMNCPETEASIFENEAWMPPFAPVAAEPAWIRQLATQHQTLIDICEEKQDLLFNKLAEASGVKHPGRKLEVGDCAFLRIAERQHSKIQSPWSGPFLVVGFTNNDSNLPTVMLQHLSTKKTGVYHQNMLKFCDLSLLPSLEAAIPFASQDNFEYEVAEVIGHRPAGPRRVQGKLRPKSDYEFLCVWKDLELDGENPSWEPWTNTSLHSCEAFQSYLQLPSTIRDLGSGF